MVFARKNIPQTAIERGATSTPELPGRKGLLRGAGGTSPRAENPGAFVYERGGNLAFFTKIVNIFRH